MDWNAKACPWIDHEAGIETAHAPVKSGLLDRAALKPGEAVLDIGCGSGATSLEAVRQVGPEGRVIAFDIAPAFVARVAERAGDHANVATMQGDAEHHDFAGFRCDVILSLFGMMFFQDRVSAFRNVGSALSPGGRLVFATWAGPQHNPWFTVPGRSLAETFPDMPKPDPNAPGPMSFADSDMVMTLLSETGFTEISAEEVDTHLTPVGAAADVAAMMMAVGPVPEAIARFAPDGDESALMDAIAERMSDGYGSFHTDDGIRVPARVIYYKATKAP